MISVVIPVYNVSQYLKRCLDSVLGQTYQELEIILVDDGSTDESPAICDRYAEADSRITVIHQQNQGLSGARNTGIDKASGEYIAFVDSDDFIHPAMYESMVSVMQQTGADMVVSGIVRLAESEIDGFSFPQSPSGPLSVVTFNTRETIFNQLRDRDVQTVVAWSKLYKKELFATTRFPLGRLHEDAAVIHEILWNCRCVSYADADFYYYVQRGASIMGNALESEKGILDGIAAYQDRIRFFQEKEQPAYAFQAKSMMFGNLLYKFSLLSKNGYNDKCAWLGTRVAALIELYGKDGLSRDVILLAKNPHRYYVKTKICEKLWRGDCS